MINKDLIAAWVSELRSGKWVQVKGTMTDHRNGRCALGVLADLVNDARVTCYSDLSLNTGIPLENGRCFQECTRGSIMGYALINDEMDVETDFLTLASMIEYDFLRDDADKAPVQEKESTLQESVLTV